MPPFAGRPPLQPTRARWLVRGLACLAAAPLVTACGSSPEAVRPQPAPEQAWEAEIVPGDRDRLARLSDAWAVGLRYAQEAGHGPELRALGSLADSAAALPGPAPRPGRYRCRTIKLGGERNTIAYVAYSWFECEVTRSGDRLRLDKLTGSQRQHGILYPDSRNRMVFLGTLALGSGETTPPTYGSDPERNVVGVVERIGTARWRLVQPWPHFESNLDLLELEPITDGAR